MRTLQRTHIAFGSPSMPVHHTRRSRRKRGRIWRVSPISTSHRPARQSLIMIFKEATRLEADFWEMGWRAGQRVE
jgi:hypothetical protein